MSTVDMQAVWKRKQLVGGNRAIAQQMSVAIGRDNTVRCPALFGVLVRKKEKWKWQ